MAEDCFAIDMLEIIFMTRGVSYYMTDPDTILNS